VGHSGGGGSSWPSEEWFLIIEGKLQHVENVIHVKAERIERLDHGSLAGVEPYDFK
jgi:hypothetical protein